MVSLGGSLAVPGDPQWRSRTFNIQGIGITNVVMRTDWESGTIVELELAGNSAEDFLRQVNGLNPASPTSVDHQAKALAAARRDAAEAKRRAVAAETQNEKLQDEISDYQGEIDVLNEEIVRERNKPLVSIDPASGNSSRWARGGYVPGLSIHGRSAAEQRELLSRLYGWAPPAPEPEPAPTSPPLRGTMTDKQIKRIMDKYHLDKYSIDGETP